VRLPARAHRRRAARMKIHVLIRLKNPPEPRPKPRMTDIRRRARENGAKPAAAMPALALPAPLPGPFDPVRRGAGHRLPIIAIERRTSAQSEEENRRRRRYPS